MEHATSEKSDEDDENCSGGKEIETTMFRLVRIDAWTMHVLECLWSGQNRGENRQKHFIETFHKFIPIGMWRSIGSLYKVLEEWKPKDLVTVPEYSNNIEQEEEEEHSMECSFRKKYKACVNVFVPKPKRSYVTINEECFSKYVGD